MNVYQAESALARARGRRDMTDPPVASAVQAKTGDPGKGTAKKKAVFLRAFEKNFSVALSAGLAGIDRSTHYEWLAKDAKYKAAFEMQLMMASDAVKDELAHMALVGDFVPLVYRGRFSYEKRIRIICQLADGTSAFQDELPKGAKVTSSRMVTTHDGKMFLWEHI